MRTSAALRTLRARLVAGFLAATGAGLVVVAVYVLPTLSTSLEQQTEERLRADAERAAARVERLAGRAVPDARLRREVAASRGEAERAVLLEVQRTPEGPTLAPRADSATSTGAGDPPALALRAARSVARARSAATRRSARANGRVGGERALAVAVPVGDARPPGFVLVLVGSRAAVGEVVDLVERRLVAAVLLGALVAVLLASTLAGSIARRVRRLEAAARSIAAGRFDTPLPAGGGTELAALGRSLAAMQRQLGELDGSRKHFIATASHELRTPLSSLSGYVELLRDEELDEETRTAFLDELAAQVRRMTGLADELLDLSRIESGGVALQPRRVDLHELVREVVGELRGRLAREGRTIVLRLGRGSLIHDCDPDRVAQVLRILVDNALKHAPAGGEVEIGAGRRAGSVRLAVTDAGPGIAPDEQRRIFEPFRGSGDGSGAGLGLAIGRELAQRMRGTLTVDSRPGRTTFVLELPL